jgi:hypothetical protein
LNRFLIAWNKRSNRCNAGFSPCRAYRSDPQNYSPRSGRTAQPEVSCTPYFLD